jgi:hypothetical protein
MSLKQIDPKDTYIVREMFGCGHGHVLPPGFTHWEEGEACIHGHEGPPTDNASYHLYWRLVLVPVYRKGYDGGEKLWDVLRAEPNKWAHLPLAPKGMKAGQKLSPADT